MTIEPLKVVNIPDYISNVEQLDEWANSLTDEDYETIGTMITYDEDEEE